MVMAERAESVRVMARVYAYVRAYHAERGMAPTMREIADGCTLSSTSVAAYWVGRLREGGYVRSAPPRMSRASVPVEQ